MYNYENPGTLTLKDQRFHLQIDPPALFRNVRQAIVASLDGDLGTAKNELFKALGTFSATNSLEHQAYRLVFNALHRACVAVMTSQIEQRNFVEKALKAGRLNSAFYSEISRTISENGYALDLDFWQSPEEHSAVRDTQKEFSDFLVNVFEADPKHAAVLAAALPKRFVQGLAEEWNRADYQLLYNHFHQNPFLPQLKHQALHEQRHADLLSRFAKPAFDDPKVTLAEMYIAPYFWVHNACVEQKKGFNRIDHKKEYFPYSSTSTPSLLHPYIADWLQQTPKLGLNGEKGPLLVLLGQPGQGKTSFCLRTADQCLREQPDLIDHLYFLRLRDMTTGTITRLIGDPLNVIWEQVRLADASIAKDFKNSLLLLDGLDELYMSQGLTMTQINDLIRNLDLQLRQHPEWRTKAILTSRTNYLKLENYNTQNFLVLHLAELNLEQQEAWLSKYEKHYGPSALTTTLLHQINKEESTHYKAIKELVNQPILLHLVTVSGVDIQQTPNAAKIYEKLFDLMIERKWSADGQLKKYEQLTQKDLRKFLRQLAHYIFQSDHEHVRRRDFETEGLLKDTFERIKNKIHPDAVVKDLVKDVLVSFYFQEVTRTATVQQQTDDHDQYAFEFLHKSLQEYLAAEHIWETVKAEFLQKDKDGDYVVHKWQKAMEVIAPLFEQKVISQEIADYLHEIIANEGQIAHHSTTAEAEKAQTDKIELKERLKLLLPALVEHQFLAKHEPNSAVAPLEKIMGNFFGFWTIASGLVEMHELPSPSNGTYEIRLNIALQQENLIPLSPNFGMLLRVASYVQSRVWWLPHQDLSMINLSGANLYGANLYGAYLGGADLSGAYLYGAYLSKANLRGANLLGANCIRTDLSGASLYWADLSGVTIREADLREADFSQVNLNRADLSQSILDEVYNLDQAIGLDAADFRGTIYEKQYGSYKEEE